MTNQQQNKRGKYPIIQKLYTENPIYRLLSTYQNSGQNNPKNPTWDVPKITKNLVLNRIRNLFPSINSIYDILIYTFQNLSSTFRPSTKNSRVLKRRDLNALPLQKAIAISVHAFTLLWTWNLDKILSYVQLEKLHWKNKCCRDSSSWKQITHLGSTSIPQFLSVSLVESFYIQADHIMKAHLSTMGAQGTFLLLYLKAYQMCFVVYIQTDTV